MEPYPNDYYQELAQRTGLHQYTKGGPFNGKKGALVGVKHGYIVAVGMVQKQNSYGVGMLIRFRSTENAEVVRSAVHFSATLLSALKIKDLTDKYRKEFEISESHIAWTWPYAFRKPSVDLIAEMVETLLTAVRQSVAGFNGICERCAVNPAPAITLFNGIPSHFCPACQQAMKDERGVEETEYEQRPSNTALGVLYGVAGAVAGGIGWGYLVYGTHKVYAMAAIGIGFLVAWLMGKGITRITLSGRIIAGVLTLLSIVFGDLLFAMLMYMDETHAPFTMGLLGEVMQHVVEIEFRGDNFMTFVFGVLGSYYAVKYLAKPEFVAEFETLS